MIQSSLPNRRGEVSSPNGLTQLLRIQQVSRQFFLRIAHYVLFLISPSGATCVLRHAIAVCRAFCPIPTIQSSARFLICGGHVGWVERAL